MIIAIIYDWNKKGLVTAELSKKKNKKTFSRETKKKERKGIA